MDEKVNTHEVVRVQKLNFILSLLSPVKVVTCIIISLLLVGPESNLSWGKMLPNIRCDKDSYGNQECDCPEDPITERYADISDKTCEYYYLCHLGRALKRKCEPYHAFHPELRECLPRDRIPRNICKPLVNCPMRPNRYVEDPEDCTKYFLCFFGKHSHWSCPENTYFDPSQEKCIPDRAQAAACIELANKSYFKKIGFNNAPPKTSVALDKAKSHMAEEQSKKKSG
ncbi:unnamed protein product [Orchesella dallaii]|uniref:Chitin-binding type-2 domain-containing protein n=1 Tax=Orchesella dallaii TaxID=48710 RepID=A0ABP1PR28_9HEXA